MQPFAHALNDLFHEGVFKNNSLYINVYKAVLVNSSNNSLIKPCHIIVMRIIKVCA